MFAGLLGAAPASGSPSLVFWVWLVARWYGESSCRSVPSTAWPLATPWAVGQTLATRYLVEFEWLGILMLAALLVGGWFIKKDADPVNR